MKIKVEKVEKRTSKAGKDYYLINFDGGKNAIAFDAEFANKEGQEIDDVIAEDGKDKNGNPMITLKIQKSKGGFAPKGKSDKEIGMEFRAKSLEYAIESAKLANVSAEKASYTIVLNVAKAYYKYIETGE